MNSRAALFSAQPSVLNAAADAHALCVPIVCKSAYAHRICCENCASSRCSACPPIFAHERLKRTLNSPDAVKK
jgi:hypothetical protein